MVVYYDASNKNARLADILGRLGKADANIVRSQLTAGLIGARPKDRNTLKGIAGKAPYTLNIMVLFRSTTTELADDIVTNCLSDLCQSGSVFTRTLDLKDW